MKNSFTFRIINLVSRIFNLYIHTVVSSYVYSNYYTVPNMSNEESFRKIPKNDQSFLKSFLVLCLPILILMLIIPNSRKDHIESIPVPSITRGSKKVPCLRMGSPAAPSASDYRGNLAHAAIHSPRPSNPTERARVADQSPLGSYVNLLNLLRLRVSEA